MQKFCVTPVSNGLFQCNSTVHYYKETVTHYDNISVLSALCDFDMSLKLKTYNDCHSAPKINPAFSVVMLWHIFNSNIGLRSVGSTLEINRIQV